MRMQALRVHTDLCWAQLKEQLTHDCRDLQQGIRAEGYRCSIQAPRTNTFLVVNDSLSKSLELIYYPEISRIDITGIEIVSIQGPQRKFLLEILQFGLGRNESLVISIGERIFHNLEELSRYLFEQILPHQT
jgi:hypothetical protein